MHIYVNAVFLLLSKSVDLSGGVAFFRHKQGFICRTSDQKYICRCVVYDIMLARNQLCCSSCGNGGLVAVKSSSYCRYCCLSMMHQANQLTIPALQLGHRNAVANGIHSAVVHCICNCWWNFIYNNIRYVCINKTKNILAACSSNTWPICLFSAWIFV